MGNLVGLGRWVTVLKIILQMDGRTLAGIYNKTQIPEKRAGQDKISSRDSGRWARVQRRALSLRGGLLCCI